MRLDKAFCGSIIVFAVFSCNGNQKKLAEQLQAKMDSLQIANDSLAEEQRSVSGFLDVITKSLDSIAEQENYIQLIKKGGEGRSKTKAEYRQSLDDFAKLLERQRNRIAQLEDSLSNHWKSFEKLSNLVTYLKQQIDEKNQMIDEQKKIINKQGYTIREYKKENAQLTNKNDSLINKNDSLSNVVIIQRDGLIKQDSLLNKGYYIIGSKTELKNAGVLTGDILRRKKLNRSNFGDAGFTEVDVRDFTDITINSKRVEILTEHPKGSYTKESNGKETKIVIKDPTSFWKVSNYLVIQTKK